MNIEREISRQANKPLPRQFILSLLNGYSQPNDKVHTLIKGGILTPLKKGLYIAGDALHTTKPSKFLVANHLHGPSYISADSALSYYGLIPERVFETVSMTSKAARNFNTTMGSFSYTHLPLPYYAFGINQTAIPENQFVLIASPEKALFDKIITTPGVLFRSISAAEAYLLENSRMDNEVLKHLDIKQMKAWLNDAPKRESLSYTIQLISKL